MKILLISPNNVYATNRLKEEALKQAITIEQFSVKDLVQNNLTINPKNYDLLYVRFAYPYFQEIFNLIEKFREASVRVVDDVASVFELDPNKLADGEKLFAAGISTPKTFAFAEIGKLSFPFILKTKFGFGKKEVFLVNNETEVEKVLENFNSEELLAQEFIQADAEYKVICTGYKSVEKVLKFKTLKDSFGIDNKNFAVLDKAEHRGVVGLVENGSKVLGKQLSKADVLESNGKYYVVEINRSPGFQSFEKLSGENIAEKFITYLKNLDK